jgi:steroid delta-isomerase-like uncharacterized protein
MSKHSRRTLSAACCAALLLGGCGKEPEPKPAGDSFVAAIPAAPTPTTRPAATPAPTTPTAGTARMMLGDWLSAWNAHDQSQAEKLLADDVEYFDAGFAGIQHGREAAIERGMSVFLRGVPDLHIELRGEPIVGTDAVAWEWTFTGTNTGTWGGIAPTNQKIQLKGFSLMRLRNGKIVQLSSYYDTGTLNRQLGL